MEKEAEVIDKMELEVQTEMTPELVEKVNKGMEKDIQKLEASKKGKKTEMSYYSEQELTLLNTVFKIARAHMIGTVQNDEEAIIELINLKSKVLNK